MVLKPGFAFCVGCGKPREILFSRPAIDDAHALVQCGRVVREAVFDSKVARRIIRERRQRRKMNRATAAVSPLRQSSPTLFE
jgi:hypothetical protein